MKRKNIKDNGAFSRWRLKLRSVRLQRPSQSIFLFPASVPLSLRPFLPYPFSFSTIEKMDMCEQSRCAQHTGEVEIEKIKNKLSRPRYCAVNFCNRTSHDRASLVRLPNFPRTPEGLKRKRTALSAIRPGDQGWISMAMGKNDVRVCKDHVKKQERARNLGELAVFELHRLEEDPVWLSAKSEATSQAIGGGGAATVTAPSAASGADGVAVEPQPTPLKGVRVHADIAATMENFQKRQTPPSAPSSAEVSTIVGAHFFFVLCVREGQVDRCANH